MRPFTSGITLNCCAFPFRTYILLALCSSFHWRSHYAAATSRHHCRYGGHFHRLAIRCCPPLFQPDTRPRCCCLRTNVGSCALFGLDLPDAVIPPSCRHIRRYQALATSGPTFHWRLFIPYCVPLLTRSGIGSASSCLRLLRCRELAFCNVSHRPYGATPVGVTAPHSIVTPPRYAAGTRLLRSLAVYRRQRTWIFPTAVDDNDTTA